MDVELHINSGCVLTARPLLYRHIKLIHIYWTSSTSTSTSAIAIATAASPSASSSSTEEVSVIERASEASATTVVLASSHLVDTGASRWYRYSQKMVCVAKRKRRRYRAKQDDGCESRWRFVVRPCAQTPGQQRQQESLQLRQRLGSWSLHQRIPGPNMVT